MMQALTLFLNELQYEKQVSPHTLAAYKSDLMPFIKHFDSQNPSSLNTFRKILKNSGLKKQSIQRKQSAINRFLNFLKRENHLSNDFHQLKSRKNTVKHLPKTLNKADIQALIESPNGHSQTPLRDRAIMELLYGSGLRVSECISLTIFPFKKERFQIRIHGKGQKDRLIPLTEVSQRYITAYIDSERSKLSRNNSPNTLFLNKNGQALTRQGLYSLIQKYVKIALPHKQASPHTFRHSFATHLIENDAPIRDVQVLLGHKSINTTQIYTKVSANKVKAMYQAAHPRAGIK